MYCLSVRDEKYPDNSFSCYGELYQNLRLLEEAYSSEAANKVLDQLIQDGMGEVVLDFGDSHMVHIAVKSE